MYEKKKVLVFQTAFLGDCLLTLPLINSLKKCLGYDIDVICRRGTEEVFKSCPSVSETNIFYKNSLHSGIVGLFKIRDIIKKNKYEQAYLPQRSFRSGLVCRMAGIKELIGFNRGGAKIFLSRKVPFNWDKHEILRELDLIGNKSCPDPEVEFNLCPDPALKSQISKDMKLRGKLVAIAPQSRWGTKRWPADNFARTAEKLAQKNTVLILGSEAGDWEGRNIINLTGRTDLKKLIAVLSLADLLISNDSGLMHIASALKVPVVVIYGSTVPSLGFTPWGEHIVVETFLKCRPCSLHGPQKCPEGHFKCMKDIKVDRVLEAAGKLLDRYE